MKKKIRPEDKGRSFWERMQLNARSTFLEVSFSEASPIQCWSPWRGAGVQGAGQGMSRGSGGGAVV